MCAASTAPHIAQMRDSAAAAMRPFTKLLWTLVFSQLVFSCKRAAPKDVYWDTMSEWVSKQYRRIIAVHCLRGKKSKGSPYSITERRVLELIPVLDSQPAGEVSHKPGDRLPLLSARPAVTLAALLPISLLGEQRHDRCEQFA